MTPPVTTAAAGSPARGAEPAATAVAQARERHLNAAPVAGRRTVTAVMTSFNKRADVRANLDGLRAQTVKFDRIVVVDNRSTDGTIEMISGEYPEVDLVVMPHSGYGACETFNIGFATARTEFIAILDDDVVLPPDWNDRMLAKFAVEPQSTAMISSHVDEPNTPDWYHAHPDVTRERYMATFRGCATLARRDVLEACGWYDEDFFIYGNERDLASRVLARGHRILQFPSVVVKHGTPFGMKGGRRSLYYHVRNLWWYLFKNVPWTQVARFVWRQSVGKLLPRRGAVCADAVGTIGLKETIRAVPFGRWVVVKATLDAFLGLPRCLRKRAPVRAPDFRLPDG